MIPILRPAALGDVESLIHFAQQAAYGITSLPRLPNALEEKIHTSIRTFHEPPDHQNEVYLFCLEWEGKVVGTSGVISHIGRDHPFYVYHLKREPLQCRYLGIQRETDVLHFTLARKKPTEIGTLFLAPELRHKDLGKFLSLSRFLFIASFRERFASTVIAELRGVNVQGNSPFWDAVGRPFFNVDFPKADLLRTEHYASIEELFPKHPLYVELLPKEAQAVIGKAHSDTLPAQNMLKNQGFQLSDYVDIFDAGPHFFASTDSIAVIANSRVAQVRELRSNMPSGPLAIITNGRLDFRATLAPLIEEEGRIVLHPHTAHALHADLGDSLRYYFL